MKAILLVPAGMAVALSSGSCSSSPDERAIQWGEIIRPGTLVIDGVLAELSTIGRVAVAPSGIVAFDQPGTPKLGVVDPGTGRMWRFGSSGSGPGEYPGNPPISWRGDSLLVTGRTQIAFSRDGALLSSRPVTTQVIDSSSGEPFAGIAQVVGLLSDSRYLGDLLERPGAVASAAAENRLQSAIGAIGLDGTLHRLVLRKPAFNQMGCRGPFCPRYLAAVSPAGDHYAIVGPATPEADSALATLRVFDASGSEQWSMRLAAPLRSVSQHALDSVAELVSGQPVGFDVFSPAPNSSGQGTTRGPVPADLGGSGAYLPVVRRLLLGTDETIWVQFWDDGRWCAFSGPEVVLGCLRLESGEELRAATRDGIWVVRSNRDDIPSIYSHTIRWPTRPSHQQGEPTRIREGGN